MITSYTDPATKIMRGLGRYGFAACCFVGGAYLIASGVVVVVKK